MGTALPLADPSISGQLPGCRITGHLPDLVLYLSGLRVNQALGSGGSLCGSHEVPLGIKACSYLFGK
jgi:hypothetical protein